MTARPASRPEAQPSADRFLDVRGTQLRYRDEGRGEPLIVLHGWTFDLEMWNPQVAILRDQFRLVRLDRRGHGLSGGTPDAAADAADIEDLCRHLALDTVALLGMSQGARAALHFASRSAQRVSALILDGPPALDDASDADVPIAAFRDTARRHGLEAFRRQWLAHALVQLCTEDRHLQDLVTAMIARYPGRDLLGPPASAAAQPIRLDRILAPTLVLSGEFDLPSRLQSARLLCTRLAHAEHVTIEEAGHLINLDQPARYAQLCRAFLTRHSTPNP